VTFLNGRNGDICGAIAVAIFFIQKTIDKLTLACYDKCPVGNVLREKLMPVDSLQKQERAAHTKGIRGVAMAGSTRPAMKGSESVLAPLVAYKILWVRLKGWTLAL
jgi:hypothetical protein